MKRLRFIDAYRGFALVNMIAYHWFYDYVNIFFLPLDWFMGTAAYIWQQWIAFSFVLVSGTVLNYAKHPQRRGIFLCLCGCLLTVCTYFFVPQELIVFGILSFLGVAMIITRLIMRWIHSSTIALFCIFGFLLTEGWHKGYWGFYGFRFAELTLIPPDNILFFILGIPGTSYNSADYVPIFPWIFIFWLGAFGWTWIKCKIKSQTILKSLERKSSYSGYNVLEFWGRHTLVIYLLHQPLLYFLGKSFL
jgi:uncharacterized membrane protein